MRGFRDVSEILIREVKADFRTKFKFSCTAPFICSHEHINSNNNEILGCLLEWIPSGSVFCMRLWEAVSEISIHEVKVYI